MNRLLPSMSVLMIALGLVVPVDNLGQSTGPSQNADVFLEVIATYSSMASQGTYVYLRLFSDRTAESQPLNHSDSEAKESPTIKMTLTQNDFAQIRSVVGNPKLAKVGHRYETRYAIVDTSTEWTIKIQRPEQSQIIQVLEFAPDLAKVMRHPYPEALLRLGCNIENLRNQVTGESYSPDDECKRVLASQTKS